MCTLRLCWDIDRTSKQRPKFLLLTFLAQLASSNSIVYTARNSNHSYTLDPVPTAFRIPAFSKSLTRLASIRSHPLAATRLIVTGIYSVRSETVEAYDTSPTGTTTSGTPAMVAMRPSLKPIGGSVGALQQFSLFLMFMCLHSLLRRRCNVSRNRGRTWYKHPDTASSPWNRDRCIYPPSRYLHWVHHSHVIPTSL